MKNLPGKMSSLDKNTYYIYTDASYNWKTRVAGLACIVVKNKELLSIYHTKIIVEDNNIAETEAIYYGLDNFIKDYKSDDYIIYTDNYGCFCRLLDKINIRWIKGHRKSSGSIHNKYNCFVDKLSKLL